MFEINKHHAMSELYHNNGSIVTRDIPGSKELMAGEKTAIESLTFRS